MNSFSQFNGLRGQFGLVPEGSTRSGGVLLDLACPMLEVTDASGSRVGSLLGHPVDLTSGKVPSASVRLPETLGSDLDAFIEEHIYGRLGGSFIFVLDHAGRRRVYLDAGGTMAAVFDPETGRVAGSAGNLLNTRDYDRRFDRELHGFLRVERDGWFPAGMTAHTGIRRILVNHYLDLGTCQLHRHWPLAQIPTSDDPPAACRRIAATARRTIDALRADGSVAIALTGGNESRILLAICRDIATDLDFVTIASRQQHLDCTLVSQLVSRFGLRHRFLPAVHATPEQTETYLTRAGHAMGDGRAQSFPSILPLARMDYFVNGLGGELARGFFWRSRDLPQTPLDARGMTTRLGMPVHPTIVAEVGRWLESVAGFDTHLTLDLAFLELRLGCWSFANSYGVPEVRHIQPLISRASFEAMLALPPESRRQKNFSRRMIETQWPELLEVQINRYGDYRDQVRFMKRLLSNPYLIAKKIRKKVA